MDLELRVQHLQRIVHWFFSQADFVEVDTAQVVLVGRHGHVHLRKDLFDAFWGRGLRSLEVGHVDLRVMLADFDLWALAVEVGSQDPDREWLGASGTADNENRNFVHDADEGSEGVLLESRPRNTSPRTPWQWRAGWLSIFW
jgi:hypothetical protein